MFCNYHFNAFNRVKLFLSAVVSPVQYTVNWPLEYIDRVYNYFTSQHNLLKENAVLRTQNLFLQAKVQKIIALEKENTQLHALLSSSVKFDNNVLVARLLSVNVNPFDSQVVLNKGEHDKVYIGQPVLDASGVMGQVIDVGLVNSRVLLITSTRSAVPVENTRNGLRAIAMGSGRGDLRLMYVPDTADVKVGDILVASGLGLKFPQGYPVGTITAVKHVANEQFAEIIVKPAAKLNRSTQVLLVWK
jgi:rod shape-determining protein MreC